MSSIAILAAGIVFIIAAIISLVMFFKGFGKSYLVLTIAILILVYFMYDLSDSIIASLATMIN